MRIEEMTASEYWAYLDEQYSERYREARVALYIVKSFDLLVSERIVVPGAWQGHNDLRTIENALFEAGVLPTQADFQDGWTLTDYNKDNRTDYLEVHFSDVRVGELNRVECELEITKCVEVDYGGHWQRNRTQDEALREAVKAEVDISEVALPSGWRIKAMEAEFEYE